MYKQGDDEMCEEVEEKTGKGREAEGACCEAREGGG